MSFSICRSAIKSEAMASNRAMPVSSDCQMPSACARAGSAALEKEDAARPNDFRPPRRSIDASGDDEKLLQASEEGHGAP